MLTPLKAALALLALTAVVHGCVTAECANDSDCIDPDEPVCAAGTCAAGEGEEGEGEEGEGEEGEGEEGEGEGEGPCASKCDCQAGQVCDAGACVAPPAQCASDDDCARGVDQCVNLTCNTLGQCEGEPEPCVVAEDCATDQLCTQGLECVCTDGQCTPQAPTCDDNSDCTTEPLTACDLETSSCTFGTCNNGGVICDVDNGENCATNGACVVGSAVDCASDEECLDSAEYCDVPAFGEDPGACTAGCRTDADCAGQLCSGGHTCVDDAGGFAEACEEDFECLGGLTCGAASNSCAESCETPSSSCAGGACCEISAQACCNFLGFCSAMGCP